MTRMAFLGLGCLLACQLACTQQRREAAPPIRLTNHVLGYATVAVAPALNASRSPDFDPVAVAEIMASELATVDGVTVLPVSRVSAVLAAQGAGEILSPQHALDVASRLGADAILVFAVTEYDPYSPPIVGLSAQLYGAPGKHGMANSVAAVDRGDARSADGSGADSGIWPQASQPMPVGPLSAVQEVFNASHEHIARRVEEFAAQRGAGNSPFGWRLFVVSQKHYLRFCCSSVIEALVGGDHSGTLAVNATAGEEISR